MRPFNLAEERIAERNFCRLSVNRRLKIMAVLIVLTALIGAGSFSCKMCVAGKSTSLKTQLADIQGRCLKIKRGMADLKVKASERKWQEGLTAASGAWLDMLDAILRCVPGDAWLDKLENSTQSQVLIIDGRAASFESLSLFISRLRGVRGFAEVRISTTAVNATRDGAYVDFSIQVKLNEPAADPNAAQPTLPAQPTAPAPQEPAG